MRDSLQSQWTARIASYDFLLQRNGERLVMLDTRTDISAHHRGGNEIRCFLCPCGSVCLQSQTFVLHLDRVDLVRALDCLCEVLSTPPFGFSLGGESFSACHAGDGCYYLLCRDRVVLRLSEEEARSLHRDLGAARVALEQYSNMPARVM